MTVNWDYYDDPKFGKINEKYLPSMGEGDTMATQIVTAVNKLVYKWYNDGDVFDNTHYLEGWANDLSSYANWLYEYTDDAYVRETLDGIDTCYTAGDYEDLLRVLVSTLLDEDVLEGYNEKPAVGSIYDCEGIFKFIEYEDDEDEEY
jgi:hypothetical protein